LIYEKVKDLCIKKNISIYKLEKELGFSAHIIVKWKKSTPSADKLKLLADYFGVAIEYFLEEKEEA